MVDFGKINQRSIPIVENIQKGIDVDENYNLLLKLFDPIIWAVIKKVKHNGNIDNDDLYQEASIVLYKSCLNFDLSSTNFYSYCYSGVFKYLCDFVYKFQTNMTVNKHEKERTKEIKSFQKKFHQENDRYPTYVELLGQGFNKTLIDRVYMYDSNTISYDFNSEEVREYKDDSNSIEDIVEKKILLNDLKNEFDKLDDDLKQVLELYYFENKSYRQISHEIEMSEKQIRNRKAKALSLLKKGLKDYE